MQAAAAKPKLTPAEESAKNRDDRTIIVTADDDPDEDTVDAYVALARLYRKQSRWLNALRAADHAVALKPRYSEGHFQRACALARLRRFDEAIEALKEAIRLIPSMAQRLATEPDLKPLSTLPAFKELLPKPTQAKP